MDTTGDKLSQCNEENGVDSSAVSQCMSADAPALVKQYFKVDEGIEGTPTVHINGKNVKTSYRAIHTAICTADPSLKGCSSNEIMPAWADWEPKKDYRPPSHDGVVV